MIVFSEDLFLRRYNELIEFRKSNDFYKVLKSSAILRQLLLDDKPLVHIVNRRLKLKIEFKIDNTFHLKLPMESAILYTSIELENLFIKSSKQLQILTLDKFLNLDILEIDGEKFTVIELIKFASNKQGGVHYDNLKTYEEGNLLGSLNKLELLRIPALAIAINTIVEIVMIALRPMKDALITFPKYSDSISHFVVDNENSIFFEGKQWMHIDNMHINIDDCFAFFCQIKLAHQKFNGQRFIYVVGSNNNSEYEFSDYYTKEGGIGCKVKLSYKKWLFLETVDLRNSGFYDSFISLGCVFTFKSKIAKLEIFINNNSFGSTNIELNKINKFIDRQVIGGDLEGRRNATFYIKELLLIRDGISDQVIKETNLYFERKYRA